MPTAAAATDVYQETAGELATKEAGNGQRPGFTTDNIRFNSMTDLV